MKIISKPDGEYVKTNDDVSDGDGEEDEQETITDEVERMTPIDEELEEGEENDEMLVQQEEEEGTTIFMSDTALMDSISELLNLLIDKETLSEFGWPESSVEDVNLIYLLFFDFIYLKKLNF